MNKFKEGDKVIVKQLSRGVTSRVAINDCGVISKILDTDCYVVNITGKVDEFLYDEELELYTVYNRNVKLKEILK